MLEILVSVLAVVVPLAAEPPAETLIKLTVDPTPAPRPALRYLLLPDLREMSPGNPIPNYLKAFLDQDYSTPEETLGKAALKQADRAARMDKPDWQLLPRLRTDGIGLLLPDLQKMRQLAAELQKRFRDEIAQRRFDDALATARTMFALARHTGGHPTLIGGLVGVAIGQIAIIPLEEMLDQPGCPNLYWALTNLPVPFINFDKGLEGERILIVAELRDLDDQKPMTTAQLKKAIARIELLRELGRGDQKSIDYLAERTADEKYMAAARARLIDSGIPEDRLATFSAFQVVLLNERLEFDIRRDEAMKLCNLPTWEAVLRLDALRVPKDKALLDNFTVAYQKIRRAQGRIEQRIALLRHVEAIRLYAADHAGKVPAKLADIDVPLPVDPFTGKPFRYEVRDGVAHLRGSPPKGDEKNPAYNIHYEIVVRK